MADKNVNETYGGKVQEQSDMAQKARNYPGRFGNDNRSPNDAQRQQEIDRAKG